MTQEAQELDVAVFGEALIAASVPASAPRSIAFVFLPPSAQQSTLINICIVVCTTEH
jgi:hypothetical protein